MRKLSITLLSLASIIFFCSCQKELGFEDPVQPADSTTTNNDNALLIKYIEIDSTAANSADTSMIVNFGYDAQQRLQALYITHSTGPSGEQPAYEKYIYQYNGSDTFPYRLTHAYGEDSTNFGFTSDITYLFYNAAGKLAFDSTLDYDGFGNYSILKKRYSYLNNNNITILSSSDDAADPYTQIDSFRITTGNGNVVALNAARYSFPDMTPSFNYSSVFSYDDHPNPFYHIPAFYPTISIFEYDASPIAAMQKNNVTHISQNSPSDNTTINESVTYSYRAAGYPAAFYSTYTNTGSGGTETRWYKTLFFYDR